ncbi:DUF5655 domain-containing protein [Pseudactinotalea sp. Z1732]|uniref:DUF5655 domain-containing protein n=1 Tax=Micrococcales TaxID=85006 RepID=UPI003C7ECA1F
MSERTWTEEDHLHGKPEEFVTLYRRVQEVINGFGDVTQSVSKTTVTFKGSRRGFASARPTSTGVRGYFDLTRSLGTDDRRISSVAPYQRNLNVHQYRLSEAADLDDTFIAWLREAYDVGCGAHLQSQRRPTSPRAVTRRR